MTPFPSPREIIARHATEEGVIQLQRRQLDDGSPAYEIIVDGVFLMASYNQASERTLAERALPAILARPRDQRRVLIGGLGMGFTLQSTLAADVAAVDVVELSPPIVEWNRTHFAPLNGRALADPRVTLIQDDLYHVLTTAPAAAYCAILLDVDNGPSWLAHEQNGRLYTDEALARWAGLLMAGGIFAVWSAQAEPDFLRRMEAVFDRVTETVIRAPAADRVVDHFIYSGYREKEKG